METAEILHQFERYTGKFARAAVEAAVQRREEVTPELLRILEDTSHAPVRSLDTLRSKPRAQLRSHPPNTVPTAHTSIAAIP